MKHTGSRAGVSLAVVWEVPIPLGLLAESSSESVSSTHRRMAFTSLGASSEIPVLMFPG